MGRTVEDIKIDIKAIEEEIAILRKNPKVAEYLRMKEIVDNLTIRMAKLVQRNEKRATEEYNNCSLELANGIHELNGYIEQEADNVEVRNCVRLVNLKDGFIEEFNKSRVHGYVDRVKKCTHIFWTGWSHNRHTETTCIKCGITSNMHAYDNSPEEVRDQLKKISEKLFSDGDMCDYMSVSGEFSSFKEAKEAWQTLSKEKDSRELAPHQVVKRLLQIRDSRMRYR